MLQALRQLGNRKALPSAVAPASLWKLAPSQVVQTLLPVINQASATMDPAWHAVQLYLIPNIPIVKEPKNLRPIAPLHPGNKLHCNHASYPPSVQGRKLPGGCPAVGLPAIQIHRGCPIGGVCTHEPGSLPPRRPFEYPPEPIPRSGAAQNAWGHLHQPGRQEVKKAFDSLRHDFLEEAMREAKFEECEIQTVLFLHSQACLLVNPSMPAGSFWELAFHPPNPGWPS